MGYYSRDELREIEENFLRNRNSRIIERDVIYITIFIIFFFLYLIICAIMKGS